MKKIISFALSTIMLSTIMIPASVYASNPVIKGSFADPDIDWFDCKFWIYPTTDGNPGWSGTQFHAFSSTDMVNWTDEGIILDVADKNPGLNEKGVQIASSAWSAGNAWAPSIEKVNGKYYFFYCGRLRDDLLEKYAVKNPDGYYNDKAIGVAVADSPTGPFVANEEPLLYPAMARDKGFDVGQMIDPSVFIDDDGTPYLFFGNGAAYGVKLNEDMLSIDLDSFVQYDIDQFRESLVVFKRNGEYFFTWSDDGTDSKGYCVKYAKRNNLLSSRLIAPKATILMRDDKNLIFGTGHQSVLYLPTNDKYYISYGRHQIENGDSHYDPGNFREVCIDEIKFDSDNNIIPIKPTNTGVKAVSSHNYKTTKVASTCKAKGYTLYECMDCGAKYKDNYTDKKPHSYTEKKVAATYASAGKITYTCKNCGYSYYKTLAKLTVAKPTSVTITGKTKSFVLKWAKNSKATGYEIQYSTSKSFNTKKSFRITSNSIVSKTVKSLKAKKTYYVRIRAYKTYNGKRYYSSWVNKTVKTK